jgi:hypothetical protein
VPCAFSATTPDNSAVATSLPSRIAVDIAFVSPEGFATPEDPVETDALLTASGRPSGPGFFRRRLHAINAMGVTREQLDAILAGRDTSEAGGRARLAYK